MVALPSRRRVRRCSAASRVAVLGDPQLPNQYSAENPVAVPDDWPHHLQVGLPHPDEHRRRKAGHRHSGDSSTENSQTTDALHHH